MRKNAKCYLLPRDVKFDCFKDAISYLQVEFHQWNDRVGLLLDHEILTLLGIADHIS